MARKYGQTYRLKTGFENYHYIINGVGGIGKTTLAYQIGLEKTGSNEGTFIITCGIENKPSHIANAFGDVAPDFKTLTSIVDDLCDAREDYPNTKFVAIDSMDELVRITENYVIAEWNKTCDMKERAKSISQAYKGFQKGENRANELMLQQVMKLQDAGYSLLLIGHTKTKLKEDTISKVQFEQLTCNLDNKYYNSLKDKVNLVAMCYVENVVEDIEEKKNAFTKKTDKIGKLTDRQRVMVFADNDNAIDTKSHFPFIKSKVLFSAKNFIDAVEDALREQENHIGEDFTNLGVVIEKQNTVDNSDKQVENVPDVKTEVKEDVVEDSYFDAEEMKNAIRDELRTANDEVKSKCKTWLGTRKIGELTDDETKELATLLNVTI